MRYARLGDKKQALALAEVLGRCFAFPADEAEPWFERAGRENIRVATDRGRVVGGLMLLPMGQFFGRRSVPMTGYAGVGIAPDLRGRGHAMDLMAASLRELFDAGVPLSALYPATQTLYRKVGFEQAGGRWEVTVPVGALALREQRSRDRAKERGEVRSMRDADTEPMERAYRAVAGERSGWLDRGRYIWDRIRKPRGAPPISYVVGAGREIDGYIVFVQQRDETGTHGIKALDFVAKTAQAARRLLRLVHDDRSLGTVFRVAGSASPPWLHMLQEQKYEMKLLFHWMLRLVDLRRALEMRGYPDGVGAELHLNVRDDVLRGNAGRIVLRVADGMGEVRSGGSGRIRVDVRALATAYSGHLTAEQLRAAGAIDAPDRDLRALSAVFAGPAPSMPDMF